MLLAEYGYLGELEERIETHLTLVEVIDLKRAAKILAEKLEAYQEKLAKC